MNSINYFGYGALASPEMIEALIKRKPEGSDFYLNNYELYIQKWDELPEKVREALAEKWGSSFRTYCIRPSQGRRVFGKLWKITPEERELIRDYEFWYEPVKLEQERVVIETEVFEDSSIQEVISGNDYQPFLNDRDKTLDMARIAAQD